MNGIQLVIPMAGMGTRFKAAGFETLKPLIPVLGIPMISLVCANLFDQRIAHLIIVCQRQTHESVNLRELVPTGFKNVTILAVDEVTDGPASTVEVARPALNLNLPLVIANSDQYVRGGASELYSRLQNDDLDGALICMEDDDPKWSFAQLDANGHVSDVVEKVVVSNLATAGIYGFRRAGDAFRGFKKMRAAGDRTNGEFYVGPSYRYLAQEGMKFTVINLGQVATSLFGLGTPGDLETFVAQPDALAFVTQANEILG